VSTPFHFLRSQIKKRNEQIPFLRNWYKKKDNSNPIINYFISFINFILVETKSWWDKMCNLLSFYLACKDLPLQKGSFNRIDIGLHCLNPCIFEAIDSLASLMVLFLLSHLSPRPKKTKCKTSDNSSHHRRRDSWARSLINTNI